METPKIKLDNNLNIDLSEAEAIYQKNGIMPQIGDTIPLKVDEDQFIVLKIVSRTVLPGEICFGCDVAKDARKGITSLIDMIYTEDIKSPQQATEMLSILSGYEDIISKARAHIISQHKLS